MTAPTIPCSSALMRDLNSLHDAVVQAKRHLVIDPDAAALSGDLGVIVMLADRVKAARRALADLGVTA